MSHEPKYKLGDQVEYTYTYMTRYGVGTVVETQSTDTHTSYWVQFGMGREWLAEHEITRAASSPDEQDIENAGGSEVRSVSSTGAEKGTKPERFDLLPAEALAQVARHYGVGAQKYADHNWRKGYEWSKSYAALQRHANAFWAGEDLDAETGSPHMAGVAFHALTLLTFMDEQRDFDDRYTK